LLEYTLDGVLCIKERSHLQSRYNAMRTTYYLMQFSETKALGDAVGFGSAFLFASVFGTRLYNTRKLVPSGLLSALSLGALGVFYAAYLQDKV
uniref:Uncharacterized protein n=1 Tax=Aegilops tauschii subsp. strangulata TaxID=200361 RepID=A0A453T5K5_AEGTS